VTATLVKRSKTKKNLRDRRSRNKSKKVHNSHQLNNKKEKKTIKQEMEKEFIRLTESRTVGDLPARRRRKSTETKTRTRITTISTGCIRMLSPVFFFFLDELAKKKIRSKLLNKLGINYTEQI
jgi:hypothetical protein